MSALAKILIVDDDTVILGFLTTLMEAEGYTVLTAETGTGALEVAASHMPGLILLDLGLPDLDGMEVLRRLREWSEVPVIVVSARQNEGEKVAALDGGADDYVTKPFGSGELLARIRTALRQRKPSGSQSAAAVFRTGGLRIDYVRRQVEADGNPIHLTPIEYRIVVYLARNAGRVLTHDQIIHEVWGPLTNESQLLRVNMANIRRKIEPKPADPRYILTEVGVGYRMAEGE